MNQNIDSNQRIKQWVDKLNEMTKWVCTKSEIERRKILVNKEIAFREDYSILIKRYLEKTHSVFFPIIDILTDLKPVTDNMLVNFISGWANSIFLLTKKLTREQEDEIIDLFKPAFNVLKEFFSSDDYRENLINRVIPESAKLFPFINGSQMESENARDAIMTYIKDLNLMPISRGHLLKVKFEYLKEQRELYEEANNPRVHTPKKYEIKAIKPAQTKDEIGSMKDSGPLMSDKVEDAFIFMKGKDNRKNKIILEEGDYVNLIKWVTFYFENEFTLPTITDPIRTINTDKGNVIHTFKHFFKQEYPSHTRPDSLFKLIKSCFFQYRNDNIENMKKTKEPQYYSHLVRNMGAKLRL